MGSKCDENGHKAKITCDFLTSGKTYTATIYADAPEARYGGPTADRYVITKRKVTRETILDLVAQPGGGWAVSFK